MPALLTNTFSAPYRCTAASMASFTLTSLLTSQRKKLARPPACVRASTVVCAASPSRSRIATEAPSSHSTWAVAAPIPMAPPVTMAVFPSNRIVIPPAPLLKPEVPTAPIYCRSSLFDQLLTGDSYMSAANMPSPQVGDIQVATARWTERQVCGRGQHQLCEAGGRCGRPPAARRAWGCRPKYSAVEKMSDREQNHPASRPDRQRHRHRFGITAPTLRRPSDCE